MEKKGRKLMQKFRGVSVEVSAGPIESSEDGMSFPAVVR
jgi:hypothetical protein